MLKYKRKKYFTRLYNMFSHLLKNLLYIQLKVLNQDTSVLHKGWAPLPEEWK